MLLQEIARSTGARAFSATTSSELQQIYRSLGTRVSEERQRREVSAAFVGGGLALLLAGGLASSFWLKRLP